MQENMLKVRMFGTFTMEYRGKLISLERSHWTKANQLLQRLLCSPDGIEREQLWHDLFLHEDVANPSGSLRTLLFRLRKSLKEQGVPGEDYVHIRKRMYYFEPDCPVECDIYEFEHAIEAADKETNEEVQYSLLKKAEELYAGEFLQGLGTVDWAVVLNVKYKKMYTNCVGRLCEVCRKNKEFKSMKEIAEKASAIYPFDGWQSYQMEALVALGCEKEAVALYENTEQMLLEELGVALPQRMIDMMGELGKQVRSKTNLMSDVLARLNESEEVNGAYECTYLNFVECYHLVSRMIGRTGQSAWLILCTVTDGKGYALGSGSRLEQLQEELAVSIRTSLRKGDMFVRYSDNQYLILLVELKQEDCKKVVSRISANLTNSSRKKYYTYHIAPVTNTKIDDSRILTFENTWSEEDEDSR